ncbi:L,D-transpeptidase [Goodfellowiella coeruleoviolacea]|uniref:Lipoprotein-anchoring transpeptidase ErfK/SrfK n=1 Tax=Goodfellowiella coeruleoviolacea TaxID=334858 RepID=A0AAE3KF54_9PSEU|nr:Ig-like domain-containing protein [Goodfellowiella coeruleoviolacea]MCP2166026.1 Lipoprotein-anchoring transpeptidase ErfK/SrfK [Goodfellowiella coeruleoviolacea]
MRDRHVRSGSGAARPLRLVTALLAGVALIAGCSSGGGGAAAGGTATVTSEAPPVAKITASAADGAKDVSVAEPVTLTVAEGKFDEVVLTNQDSKEVKGELSADGRTWTTAEDLGYGKTYKYTGRATGTDGKKVESTGSFTTIAPGKVVRATVNPTDGKTVGVAMPIKITFDEAVQDKAAVQKALSVRTTPEVEGAWAWVKANEVHWRPREYWPANTKVSVAANLYGVPLGGGAYGKADLTTEFSIGRNQVVKMNTPSHKMDVYRDGVLVKSYPASYGDDNNPDLNTPNGTLVVMEKEEVGDFSNPKYGYTNVMKKWAVRISNHGEFIHENNDNAANIGRRNTSHGCANLLEHDAKDYFDSALIGDPVEITGSKANMPTTSDVFDWLLTWDQWLAKSAL